VPRIAPFEALIYDEQVAGPIAQLTAPPYDVISEDRRRSLLAGSPYSIVHLDLGEPGQDRPRADDDRYASAAQRLSTWRHLGVLAPLRNSYFAYEMRYVSGDTVGRVRGLLCAMTLEPWGGTVLPHEDVMPEPVADRLRLLRATRAQLSPVYGTIAGPCPSLNAALDLASGEPPLFEVHDREGVTHRLWSLALDPTVEEELAPTSLLIADGHHRYTTALAYREERHASDGPGPWDRILTLLVDAGTQHVPVLPYHRLQLRGAPPTGGQPTPSLTSLLDHLDDTTLRYGTAVPGDDGPIYRLHDLPGQDPPTVRALHRALLDRTAPGDALRFTHEADEADEAVRSGEVVAAYFLPPTSPERILSAIAHGGRLPRKSTFFWPKPLSGMTLMPVD
jgi:uncharacterized protein (DUF1015 family)